MDETYNNFDYYDDIDDADVFINNDNITDAINNSSSTSKKKSGTTDDTLVKDLTKEEKKSESSSASEKLDNSTKKNNKKRASLGKLIGGLGGSQPIVKINNYIFSSKELSNFKISLNTFVPTIEVTVKLDSGKFMVKDFPKDGDLMSVYIRSYTEVFKPISNDYLITNVVTTRSGDKEGSNIIITFYGILNINYLYAESCRSIKDKTSFDALLEIASFLKLGFVSNIKSTNDKMNWLCTYYTNKKWIDDITIHAYKDDSCFFDSWVDYYYQLNFAELNRIYAVGDKVEPKDGLMFSTHQKDHNVDDSVSSYKTKNVLCNDFSYEKTNYYFNSMQLISRAGNINIFNGYKRYIHFYDVGMKDEYMSGTDKHSIIYVDPIVTKGTQSYKHIQKGRSGEDYYKDTNKHIWQGIQYSNAYGHNVHPYWKYAEYNNFQNLKNIDKLILKLYLPKCNFNLYKGQRISVVSMITRDPERIRVGGHDVDDFKSHGFVIDRFISANNYVITGINIIYESVSDMDIESKGSTWGQFRQEVILSRREWELPNVTEKIDISSREL